MLTIAEGRNFRSNELALLVDFNIQHFVPSEIMPVWLEKKNEPKDFFRIILSIFRVCSSSYWRNYLGEVVQDRAYFLSAAKLPHRVGKVIVFRPLSARGFLNEFNKK